MTDEVVLCTKVPAELARRFDAKAAPNRSVTLRRLVEGFVEDTASTVPTKPPDDRCSCPEPELVELATGAFCVVCRKKTAGG